MIVSCLLLLLARIGYLSLYTGEMLAESSVRSHLIRLAISYDRGDIYDRNGVCITNQREAYYAAVFPKLIDEPSAAISCLAALTGRGESDIGKYYRRQEPFCIQIKDAPKLGMIREGILLFARKIRYAPDMTASHILGYVRNNDRTGVGGIESMYNELLKSDSIEYLQSVTDGRGEVIRGAPYRMKHEEISADVFTTLDWELQQEIEALLDKRRKKGSVVVMSTDGEILAMVSRPSFRIDEIADSLSRDDAPFLNRALQPSAVGSVFKIVTALAGLELQAVSMEDVWEDAGRIEVAGITFRGWDDSEDYIPRKRNLTEAMAHSSNSVFIQIGTKIGAKKIVEMARRLGFGEPAIKNCIEEKSGNLPNGQNLYIAETANLAIGQGVLLATPMQVTKMMAIIANGGYDAEPHLLKDATPYRKPRVLNERSVREVQTMLAAVVDSGTGRAAQSKQGQASGKTGSAEIGKTASDGKSVSHAWFSGYFPREKPRYVCTVMIEEGNSGGKVAAPIFREIMEIIHQKERLYSSQK